MSQKSFHDQGTKCDKVWDVRNGAFRPEDGRALRYWLDRESEEQAWATATNPNGTLILRWNDEHSLRWLCWTRGRTVRISMSVGILWCFGIALDTQEFEKVMMTLGMK